jgi:CDP-glycerol glycerophosphotransferase (TagB/SpsB family)
MSSVILDIVLTKKPLLFAFGGEGRSQDETAYDPIKEIYQANPTINLRNVRNVNAIIKHALYNRLDEESLKKSLERVHYGLDGKNIEDTVDLIKSLAENRFPALKPSE